MRELFVVRHGEAEGNALGIAQGRLPYPLTERGREQAAHVAQLMTRLGWAPTCAVSSPLTRCVQTAEIVAERLGLGAPQTDEAFTEIDCGTATGQTFSSLRESYPGFFDRPASEWLGFKELGGESDDELIERVGAGLDALPRDERILLVTHGAVFKGILAHLLGFSTQFFLDLRCGTCLRLERRTIGASEVVALTHFLHPEELEA